MATVNIGADNADDAFYRYKMPKLQAKIEGRGNGIKTNLVNMVDVAKALSRPPSYTTKYFGCVLGAQSKFDEKTGTSTVNGAHDGSKLAQHLEGFIKTYVQCYSCGNPETEINITKSQCINLKCAACGAISDVDMRDKLTTFILKNPPEVKKKKGDKNMRRAEKERLKAGEALDEESKKPKKDVKGGAKKGAIDGKKKKKGVGEDAGDKGEEDESPESSQKDEVEEEEEVEWQTDTSVAAAKKRLEQQLTAAAAGMVLASSADDEAPPATPRSPAGANGTLSNGNAGAEEHADLKDEQEADDEQEEGEAEEDTSPTAALVHELVDYIQTHKLVEVADYVSKKEPNVEFFVALVQAIFHNVAKGFAKEVTKKKPVLAAAVKDEAAQKLLLVGVEHFFGAKAEVAAKEVALVLKALYDEEVVDDEDVIFSWEKSELDCPGLSPEKAASVRKLSLPFLDWLREADEEEEEEE